MQPMQPMQPGYLQPYPQQPMQQLTQQIYEFTEKDKNRDQKLLEEAEERKKNVDAENERIKQQIAQLSGQTTASPFHQQLQLQPQQSMPPMQPANSFDARIKELQNNLDKHRAEEAARQATVFQQDMERLKQLSMRQNF
jgi:predicted type IV restriction endonuclease